MEHPVSSDPTRAHYKAKNSGKREFDSKWKERLSKTPIFIPISLFFIASGGLLYFAIWHEGLDWKLVTGIFFAGWFTFTFIEYCMHRFLFHMRITTKIRKMIQYNFHGVHHEYPKDKNRLAMPLPASITLAFGFYGLFWLLMETYTYGFLPGILVGYASYLFVHFIVHAFQPPNNYLKHLWISHAIHHYKDDSVVYGVTWQFWDFVFGTMPKKDKA